jgi:hypothetical protein
MATRGLLLAVYFAEGAGLLLLISFYVDSGLPARIGMAAIWLLPNGLVFFGRSDLRGYLPGPLLLGFGLFLGMFAGVIAEMLAEGAGSTPVVAKGLFVGVGAAATAVIVSRAFRQEACIAGSPATAEPSAAVKPAGDRGPGSS